MVLYIICVHSSSCPTHQEPSLQVAEELAKAKEDADHAHQEWRQMKEQLDRTVAEKCQLEDKVEDQKMQAKKWKMQLDETTAKLLQKQDEVNELKEQLETAQQLVQVPIN